MAPSADVEWAKLSWTIIAALGTALVALGTSVWAVFTWAYQRWQDRRTERRRIAALYVHPFLFAAEELQSRLYNLVEDRGLKPLMDAANPHPFAEETVYLIAQYFAWERAILRYGPYTGDTTVITLTGAVRDAFATDKLDTEMRIFRPEQGAIAQAMMRRVPGQLGPELEVISSQEFRRALRPPASPPRLAAWLGSSLPPPETSALGEISSLRRAVASLAAATDPDSPPGAPRLARVQRDLVALLKYLEKKERLSLFDGTRNVAGQRPESPLVSGHA